MKIDREEETLTDWIPETVSADFRLLTQQDFVKLLVTVADTLHNNESRVYFSFGAVTVEMVLLELIAVAPGVALRSAPQTIRAESICEGSGSSSRKSDSSRMLCLSSGSASSEGLALCGLGRRVLQRDLVNLVSLWSISWLCHQMFHPYITISAAQAHESDDLRHTMSPLTLFLSSFLGVQRILGYVRPRRIAAVHPPKTGRRRSIWRSLRIGTDFMQRCDVIGLQMLLRRTQQMFETLQIWSTVNMKGLTGATNFTSFAKWEL